MQGVEWPLLRSFAQPEGGVWRGKREPTPDPHKDSDLVFLSLRTGSLNWILLFWVIAKVAHEGCVLLAHVPHSPYLMLDVTCWPALPLPIGQPRWALGKGPGGGGIARMSFERTRKVSRGCHFVTVQNEITYNDDCGVTASPLRQGTIFFQWLT